VARVGRLVERKRRVEADIEAVRAHWQGIGNARVAEIVGAASDAIVAADTGGRIVLANRAACTLFGVPAGAAVGLPLQTFLPTIASRGSTGPAAAREQVRRRDGSTVAVEVALSQVGSGDEALQTCVLRDTTERDRSEADQRQRSEADAARRATAAMLSFIAHEMGNPLNAILGFSELARSDAAEPLPAAQAQRLGYIVDSARRLQLLMQDVIDLNRLEAGQFRIESSAVDPAQVVRDVCTELAPAAERAGVALVQTLPPAPALVTADPRRLHQCLANLASNAIKYGGRGGRVEIAVQPHGPQVLIAVRDTGPGLTPAQCARLFEPYNRLGRDATQVPGTGLGLLLTRELAAAMGGRLAVDSEVGAGSCFTLRLARVPAAAPAPAATGAP
jgi:PAS domain S-box-containing protein